MAEHQQLADAFMTDAVLAGQDQGVGEELLADGTDELPLNVLDGDLGVKEIPQPWVSVVLLFRLSRRSMDPLCSSEVSE